MSEDNTRFKIGIAITVMIIITGFIIIYTYSTVSDNKTIDDVDYLEGPHLSGDVVVEVDYMQNCEVDSDVFSAVEDFFAGYNINLTFIIDDRVVYVSSITDDDVHDYHDERKDTDADTYMLIATSKSDESNILGSAYSKDETVIYYETIEDSFGNTYKNRALVYVIIHEILHQYGCAHTDDNKDVMYPYISITRLILYPDPDITDVNTLAELSN